MSFFKSNLFLWILVILVVGYAYFFEYKGKQKEQELEEANKKILDIPWDEVNYVKLKTSKGQAELVKDQTWKVTAPFNDLADLSTLESFINSIKNEKHESVIVEGEFDKSIYGLNDPYFVELKTPQKSHKIEIGTIAGMSGKKYLRVDDKPQVLLGSFTWETLSNKDPQDFRSKNIVQVNESQISKISYKNKNQSLNFSKNDQFQWSISELKTKDIDLVQVQNFISSITNLRASQIDESKKSQKPILTQISLESDAGKVDIKVFEPDSNLSRVEVSDRNIAFKISNAVASSLIKNLDDFRDRKKPFNFLRNEIQKVTVHSPNAKFDLSKKDSNWLSNDPKVEVDTAEVERFLNKLSALRVHKFFGNTVNFQNSGATVIELFNKDQSALKIEISPRAQGDSFVTRTSLSEEFVSLSIQDFNDLKPELVFKKSNENLAPESIPSETDSSVGDSVQN